MAHIANHCPQLIALSVGDSAGYSDEVMALVFERCPLLEVLDVQNTSTITIATFRSIASHLVHLRYVRFHLKYSEHSGEVDIDQAFRILVAGFRHLVKMDLKRCVLAGVPDSAVVETEADLVRELKKAQNIAADEAAINAHGDVQDEKQGDWHDLDDDNEVRDSSVLAVVDKCSHITSYTLNLADEAQESTLHSLIVRFANVTELDLRHGMELLTDDLLKLVAQHCTQLRYFNIDGDQAEEFTDNGVIAVLRRNSGLTRITLSNSPQLTDQAVYEIALFCDTVRKLNLRGMAVSNNCLVCLVHTCRHLTALNLSECANISGFGVDAVRAKCRYLSQLNVEGTRVSEKYKKGLSRVYSTVYD